MNDQSELEVTIAKRLDEIKSIPARDPIMARRARARFLAGAVSAEDIQRHKGWKSIFRKEQFAMNMIISVVVIAGLLFGGGATVNAAQDDLPNEPLYGLKVWSEDVSLQLQNDPEAKVDRLMDLAQTRIQEMTQLSDAGQAVPDQLRQRLNQHLQQALQLCSSMDDPTLDRTLLQVRDRLQQQDRDMDRLQLHTQSSDTLQLLSQTRTMLRERLQLVENGLLDHEMFRYMVRNGPRQGQEEDVTPPVPNGNGQQNGQPTVVPIGPNTTPGGPNTNPGGPNLTPNGPHTDSGGANQTSTGPNTDPGGSNPDSGSNNNDSGTGTGGNGTGTGGNGSGGNHP
jgi:hypothetical protein